MTQQSPGGFFGFFHKLLRRAASAFAERPEPEIEEYVLEHLLLYHGLAGSSPQNQRQFRDVRADLHDAVAARSTARLSIALKLPPLFWEDKLNTIFSEIADTERRSAIDTLLPEEQPGELPESWNPLAHADWQVRANAAYALALLQAGEAVPRLAAALESASRAPGRAAFCHIAQALARLGGDEARAALLPYLYSEEPWFRVDAAAALARWQDADTQAELMRAVRAPHALSDYMATAIARRHKPEALLRSDDAEAQEGGVELVIRILQAASGTFRADVVAETGVPSCFQALLSLWRQEPTPSRSRALINLSRWLAEHPEESGNGTGPLAPQGPEGATSPTQILGQAAATPAVAEAVIARLGTLSGGREDFDSGALHAVVLAGDLQLTAAVPLLVPFLSEDCPFVDEVTEALGRIGDARATQPLADLACRLVDLEDRTSRQLSRYPVIEEQPQSARTYWGVLKALGGIAGCSDHPLLLRAARDFAPDKRQQALESLTASAALTATTCDISAETAQLIAERLEDPSTPVKLAALGAVEQFSLPQSINQVVALTASKETSLRNRAMEVLQSLAAGGHLQPVKDAVEGRLRSEFDTNRRQRLSDLLDSLASSQKT